MKVYIFKQESNNLYYITETSHITKLMNMFNKYCPEKITRHSFYDIDGEYNTLEINKNINFLKKGEFFDYFNHKFGEFIYKTSQNWYKLEQSRLQEVILYLNSCKPKPIVKNQNHLSTNQYKCHKCGRILSSLNYLNKHIKQCHGLTCLKCGSIFSSKFNYQTHVTNCGSFKCIKCNLTFNSNHKYKKHMLNCQKQSTLLCNPANSLETPDNSPETPDNSPETPDNSLETQANSLETHDNSPETPT